MLRGVEELSLFSKESRLSPELSQHSMRCIQEPFSRRVEWTGSETDKLFLVPRLKNEWNYGSHPADVLKECIGTTLPLPYRMKIIGTFCGRNAGT
jgi:hypothetical protein